MSHEMKNPLAMRERRLPERDASRYQTLKLVIQRNSSKSAVVSLMFTTVGGQRLSDTRIACANVLTHHPDGRDLSPLELIEEAVLAIKHASPPPR